LTGFVERVVKADGNAFIANGVQPRASRYVSRFIEDGVRRSSRMRMLAKSRQIGRPLKSLSDFWTIYEKGWSSDGWVFLAPMLKDAAPDLLNQPSLFGENFIETDTAFEFLQDALSEVRGGLDDGQRFDPDLLTDFRMDGALRNGVSVVQLVGVARKELAPADEVLRENAEALLSRTPESKRMRFVGVLDMVKSSNLNFELILSDGQRLKGVWTGEDVAMLGEHWSKSVTIDANIIYKPNGKPLRLEGISVRPPEERDMAFSQLKLEQPVRGLLSVPKGTLTVGQLMGSWPGNETDEEIAEVLARLRS
jgi:hypothetical protein